MYNRAMSTFVSPSKGKMSLKGVAKDIVAYIKAEPNKKYKLIVGTDSEGNDKVDFVIAIVIHRKGSGGRYFWRKSSIDKVFHLKQKIYQEVNLSLVYGNKLLQELKKAWQENGDGFNLEIHIDVGENGPTKDLIREVVGMVLGQGFLAKTKPQSYGASMVADRHL